MNDYPALFRQVDAYCAKLNGGLAAVAVALAVLVAAEATMHMSEILAVAPQLLDPEILSAAGSDSY